MSNNCRLCGQSTKFLYKKPQLKYNVSYYRCDSCGSMQTEEPYWLDEAYTDLSFAKDTGMVTRTLETARLALALALAESFDPKDLCIDFGGGTGMFTRFLRDNGLNAFWDDKYAKNIFSIGFEKELSKGLKPKLVTAFEVLEHLPNPLEMLTPVFEAEPEYFLCTTKLYSGQGEDWWYHLKDGQHVQFYSKEGLEHLAERFGYHLQTVGGTYHLFTKTPKAPRLLKKILKKIAPPKVESKSQKRFGSRIEEDHQTRVLAEV